MTAGPPAESVMAPKRYSGTLEVDVGRRAVRACVLPSTITSWPLDAKLRTVPEKVISEPPAARVWLPKLYSDGVGVRI
jgi:hypothetical protein